MSRYQVYSLLILKWQECTVAPDRDIRDGSEASQENTVWCSLVYVAHALLIFPLSLTLCRCSPCVGSSVLVRISLSFLSVFFFSPNTFLFVCLCVCFLSVDQSCANAELSHSNPNLNQDSAQILTEYLILNPKLNKI